jgi:hypothetical protein
MVLSAYLLIRNVPIRMHPWLKRQASKGGQSSLTGEICVV